MNPESGSGAPPAAPAAQTGCRSEDGTPIAALRRGAGPALVLVHGTDGDSARWQGLVPLLEPHFTVWAMDRRGRGGSGDSGAYSLEKEVQDVAALLRHAGPAPFLMGHSFGALCALEAALAAPGVARLVLYEPPVNVRSEDFAARAGLIGRLEGLLGDGDPEAVAETFFRERVAATRQGAGSPPRRAPRGATAATILRELHAIQQYRFDARRVGRLLTPTLLLLGSNSAPYLHAATEALHAAIPSSRIALLEGQAHTALEAAPAMVAPLVVDFLTAQAG